MLAPQILLLPPRPDTVEFGGLYLGMLLSAAAVVMAGSTLASHRDYLERKGIVVLVLVMIIGAPLLTLGGLFLLLSLLDY